MAAISQTTWVTTVALTIALLALDLVLGWLKPHRVGFREAPCGRSSTS